MVGEVREMSRKTAHLPLEVIDNIYSYLRGTDALHLCLVARSFNTDSAEAAIWHTIVLDVPLLLSERWVVASLKEKKRSLLLAGSRRRWKHVRELVLHPAEGCCGAMCEILDLASENLRTLVIKQSTFPIEYWYDDLSAKLRDLEMAHCTLGKLTVIDITFKTNWHDGDLRRLLNLAPNLRTLRLTMGADLCSDDYQSCFCEGHPSETTDSFVGLPDLVNVDITTTLGTALCFNTLEELVRAAENLRTLSFDIRSTPEDDPELAPKRHHMLRTFASAHSLESLRWTGNASTGPLTLEDFSDYDGPVEEWYMSRKIKWPSLRILTTSSAYPAFVYHGRPECLTFAEMDALRHLLIIVEDTAQTPSALLQALPPSPEGNLWLPAPLGLYEDLLGQVPDLRTIQFCGPPESSSVVGPAEWEARGIRGCGIRRLCLGEETIIHLRVLTTSRLLECDTVERPVRRHHSDQQDYESSSSSDFAYSNPSSRVARGLWVDGCEPYWYEQYLYGDWSMPLEVARDMLEALDETEREGEDGVVMLNSEAWTVFSRWLETK